MLCRSGDFSCHILYAFRAWQLPAPFWVGRAYATLMLPVFNRRSRVVLSGHEPYSEITSPGHDAWVVGDEPVVVIDITGMAEFAKPV